MRRFLIIFLSVLILVISVCSKEPVFRNTPANLSKDAAKEMMIKYDFYEGSYNLQGAGFDNNFKLLKDGNVVVDDNSRLMWQQGGSEEGYKFQDVVDYIADLNQSRFSGYDDWRLPTLEEAMSLMEPARKNDLYINPIFDSKQDWIWTSDQSKAKGVLLHWAVDFSDGECTARHFFYFHYVRAVRSR